MPEPSPAPALRVVEAGDPSSLLPRLASALDGGEPLGLLPPGDAGAAAALRPELPVDPGLALVVTTSGSTGRPKAVELSRAAVLASIRASAERLGGPGRWHLVLPAHFIAGAMVLARAVVAGTEVVLAAPDLHDLRARPGRNFVSVVPTQLVRAAASPELVQRLAEFDAVLLGGAAAPPALVEGLRARGVPLVTTYGMSETCGGCVYDGRPLPGVRVEVEEGRIVLDTPTAFSGYRGDPGLTGSVLRGSRVLTQDRGRLDDGRLSVLGRLDDVVISGGVNVDLAEVERVLQAAVGSSDLVVLGLPDAEWGTRVEVVTTLSLGVADLHVAGLQPAARPRRVTRVIGLPRLSSGKIDRQHCRDLAEEGRDDAR